MNEQEIEAAIQAKGLDAPRLAPEDIDAQIKGMRYHHFKGTTVIVCLVTLRNGFNVVGYSAAVSPENFDVEIGRHVAYDNARNHIWMLEGYRLREALFQEEQRKLAERDRRVHATDPEADHG